AWSADLLPAGQAQHEGEPAAPYGDAWPTREQDPRPTLSDDSDDSAEQPAGRAAMSHRWLARFVDAVVCLVILGLAGGVASRTADFRGGAGLTPVVRSLSWAHLGLALIVIAVYRVAAESLTGQTVGKARFGLKVISHGWRGRVDPPLAIGRFAASLLSDALL